MPDPLYCRRDPEEVPDPTAARPDSWDEEEDGPWWAPLVENPVCGAAAGIVEVTDELYRETIKKDRKNVWVIE